MKRTIWIFLISVFSLSAWIQAPSHADTDRATISIGNVVDLAGSSVCAITEASLVRCWGNNLSGETNVPADLGKVIQVSKTCALKESGTPVCWGDNYHGQRNVPSDLGTVVQISSGSSHVCALTAASLVRCWGSNLTNERDVPADLGKVLEVSSGGLHTCVLTESGLVRCWGYNEWGQTSVPADLGKVTQVRAGSGHTCAVTEAMLVRCWGFNETGQIQVPADLGKVFQVSTGSHTCALTTAGLARCWGLPGAVRFQVPANLGQVLQISAGNYSTCAVTVEVLTRCWGDNSNGQTNVPSDLVVADPPALPTFGTPSDFSVSASSGTLAAGSWGTCVILRNMTVYCSADTRYGGNVPSTVGKSAQISLGYSTACAIKSDRTITCWGYDKPVLNHPSNLGKVKDVGVGQIHACVITAADTIKCWGTNLEGRTSVPANLGKVKKLSVGGNHSCAVTMTGLARCWGFNGYGANDVPSDLGIIKDISAGDQGHTCAILQADLVSCWGQNDYGQTDVPNDLGTVTLIATGQSHTCAVKTSGAVRCWGSNRKGESSAPRIVGAVSQISAGYDHTCAALEQGKLVCWGDNAQGQIANSSKVAVELPAAPTNVTLGETVGSSLYLGFDRYTQPSDDLVIWKVTDVLSKKVVCQFGAQAGCWIQNLPFGKTYQFKLTGTNAAGTTTAVNSSLRLFCPKTTSISAKTFSGTAVNGSSVTTTGSLKGMCHSPKVVEFRSKGVGKSWTTWEKHSVSKDQKFSVSKKFVGNTKVQFRVKDGTKYYLTDELQIDMRIKFALPISVYWKSAKNPQGFNQGGIITIKFGGDKEFSGTCTVLAETADGYNFALTYMGPETRFTQFKVRNGVGSGNVSMRWNGKVTVGAICKDPKFTEISEFRYVTFKANF